MCKNKIYLIKNNQIPHNEINSTTNYKKYQKDDGYNERLKIQSNTRIPILNSVGPYSIYGIKYHMFTD